MDQLTKHIAAGYTYRNGAEATIISVEEHHGDPGLDTPTRSKYICKLSGLRVALPRAKHTHIEDRRVQLQTRTVLPYRLRAIVDDGGRLSSSGGVSLVPATRMHA